MRASQYLISTQKECPADAEIISHQLMLRAGLIRKLASGLYCWLPTGLRVLRKVETIVRDEMNKTGAQEVLMPIVQPSELWQESGRWQQYGGELLRVFDRHERAFCLGPTHEEVITDLVRNEIKSYKQLPLNFYQIQTKFRDEIRPRFGVMRAREFLMKDAYSFHSSQECLQKTYEQMHQAYCNIFDRLGLSYRPVLADTGSIGGSTSHEFHVLADSGEDAIAFSSMSGYAANVELAEAIAPTETPKPQHTQHSKVHTPGQKSVEDVASFLSVTLDKVIKTLIVLGEADKAGQPAPLVALVLRGDHRLNEIKACKLEGIAEPLRLADAARVKSELNAEVGSIGPIGLQIPTIVDRAAAAQVDFVCGANQDDHHFLHANWNGQPAKIADIRKVEKGDQSPDGIGVLEIKRGIEVGHIFQLGTKYSSALKANVLDENGKESNMLMGCFGIGVSRIVAAAIEQNHDENGIIWPKALAPFQIAIVPINMHKSEAVAATCEVLYRDLQEAGFEVLLMDETKARLGAMLADIELIGISHRIVVGDRGLKAGKVEYKGREDSASQDLPRSQVLSFLTEKLQA